MKKASLILFCFVIALSLLACREEATPALIPTPSPASPTAQGPATSPSDTPALSADTPTTSAPVADTPAGVTPVVQATATQGGVPSPGGSPTTITTVPTNTAAPANPTDTAVPAEPAAALVNGEVVPLADYEAQVALAEASFSLQGGAGMSRSEREAALEQVRHQVLDWLVDQVLIEQAAERLQITIPDAQVEAELAKAKGDDSAGFARWLEQNGLTEASFKEKLRSELLGAEVRNAVTDYLPSRMEQVHLRHILVGSREEAQSVLEQIQDSGDFVRMAKEHSLDMGTREDGGDLGFYPRGILSPELDRVAFNLVTGQVSDVIQTSYGYHILQVIERAPNREIPDEMLIALRQKAFMDWLAAERERAQVEILVE